MTLLLLAAGALVVLGLMVLLVPVVVSVAGFLIGLVPVLITLAGLYSCVVSEKPSNIKLLWIVIILLAPLLGPLLWFFWGKQHT